jgi:hypothetical protein
MDPGAAPRRLARFPPTTGPRDVALKVRHPDLGAALGHDWHGSVVPGWFSV